MKKSVKWSLLAIGVILIIVLLRTFLFTLCSIPSKGMEANLKPGDHILVNKWSYGLRIPFSQQRVHTQQPTYGDVILFNNPMDTTHQQVYRKNLFISRCVGLPGDTLYVDSLFQPQKAFFNPDQKQLYKYSRIFEDEIDSIIQVLRIAPNDIVGEDSTTYIRSFTAYEYYLISQATIMQDSLFISPVDTSTNLYPIEIPQVGKTIKITPWNAVLMYNTILLHENKDVKIRGTELYLNEQVINQYTFTKDYYWMTSNNSVNFNDSRLFGYVPHTHLIGKASFIWFSKDPNQGILKGYRWNRIFNPVY